MGLKVVYFDYAAIIITLVIIISCICRKLTKGQVNKAFFLFSSTILFSSIFGTGCIIFDNMGSGNVTLKLIFHTLYLIAHNVSPVAYMFYLIALTDVWHVVQTKKRYETVIFVPIIIILLSLIINIFHPFIFCINENDVYTRLKAFIILYICAFYYLTVGIGFIMLNPKLFPTKMKYTVFMLYPVTLVATLIEFIWPHLVIECFANSLCLYVIYTNLQRQDELLNADTKFFNSKTFAFELNNSLLTKKHLTVFVINVYNYKILREIIGYENPFILSKSIANSIEKICNLFDIKARCYYLKSGQFRLISHNCPKDKADLVADALNKYLQTPIWVDDFEINLIASVCVVNCPEDITTLDRFMRFVKDINDSKYYNGKVLYAKDLYNKEYYDQLLDMNKIIEHALATDGFQMYYQPIYSIKTGKITSAEALIRLKDEKYGFISPELFIPTAEKTGAIHKIGLFVLESVCRFVASDEFKKLGIEYVEINLSVAQCMQDNLAATVLNILKKYDIPPEKINLEVTETAIAVSQEIFVKNLGNLVKSGLSISLDDFGSGYSNLQRIAELPFEIVKIDKSFVDHCNDPKVKVIMESIIKMALQLNLHIVVEGIETKEMVEKFTELKCDYIQGYYFSKPVSESEFSKFVSNFNGVSE